MFGSSKISDLNSRIAPRTIAILCHNNLIGFTGDDIGLSEKLCYDFFATPSDSGICLTKNLNINEIIHSKEEYDGLFEPHLQKSSQRIKGGTKWGEISLIFLPTAQFIYQTPVRSPGSDNRKIRIQLHQSKEFANMLKTNVYDDFLIPITLEPNHEYSIRVTPYGMESSEEFKDLTKEQRNCKLENEVEEGSIFKHYTENNCRYECTVDLAIKTCKCAPWDFIHKSNEFECDVFGRTCFYRAMENITQDSDNPCNECLPGCDQIKYKKEILKADKVIKWEIDDTSRWGNKYFNCYYFTEKDSLCSGESGFVDFFYDYNSTFMDKGFYNLQDSLSTGVAYSGKLGNSKYQRAKIYQNAIIVHLKFMQPEIDLIDVKYTFMDKIANFGGKFGIFAQLTGWSLLGILNLILVLLKNTVKTDD